MAIDQSGTITTGGTAQNLFHQPNDAATKVTPPNGFAIYNPDPANYLWISYGVAAANAAGSIPIAPLGGYETPGHQRFSPVGPVTIVGANSAQVFTAEYW